MKFFALTLLTLISSAAFADPIICLNSADQTEQVGFGYFAVFNSTMLLHSATGTSLQVYAKDLAVAPAVDPSVPAAQETYQNLTSATADNGTIRATLTVAPGTTAQRAGTYTQTVIATGASTTVNVTCTFAAQN